MATQIIERQLDDLNIINWSTWQPVSSQVTWAWTSALTCLAEPTWSVTHPAAKFVGNVKWWKVGSVKGGFLRLGCLKWMISMNKAWSMKWLQFNLPNVKLPPFAVRKNWTKNVPHPEKSTAALPNLPLDFWTYAKYHKRLVCRILLTH